MGSGAQQAINCKYQIKNHQIVNMEMIAAQLEHFPSILGLHMVYGAQTPINGKFDNQNNYLYFE